MKFPHSLKVGAHTIKVVFKSLPEGVDGEFSTQCNEISIEDALPASQKGVVFFHELFHALNAQFDEEPYHLLCESLSQQLWQVLSDNHLLK